MKRKLDAIKRAYQACIPRIIDGEIKGDDAVCQDIGDFEVQLDVYEDTDVSVKLAVDYVNALVRRINILVSNVEDDDTPKAKSPEFYRLAEDFLRQYSPRPESKYPDKTDLSTEHKHAFHSSAVEHKAPRSGSTEKVSLDKKYEPKTESRPIPAIQPVIVKEDLRTAGAQFRKQIRAESGDGVAKLLNKHGFLLESKEPSKIMAYQLLTQGYKAAPNVSKTQQKAPDGDFELAKRLQDEEIGRVFKR
jgi:hypothetical protein